MAASAWPERMSMSANCTASTLSGVNIEYAASGDADAANSPTGAEAPMPEWSRTFGTIAGLYDSARNSYPAELVEDLLAARPVDILDVGCGTGKAGALFLGDGRRVLGVEPDAAMAELARGYGLEVECAAFEEWDDDGRQFDLLISGTAWHWVRPRAGVAKAATVLRPGGRFAAFWNALVHSQPVRAVFLEVYPGYAPELLSSSFVLGAPVTNEPGDAGGTDDPMAPDDDDHGRALACGPFTGVTPGQRRQFWWEVEYTPAQFVRLAATHSDHRLLDRSVREPLLADLEAALARLGRTFTVHYRTDLLTAVRT